MRIAELPHALAEIGAGADLFSIGGPAHDRLCIERLGDRQAVYFSERGGRFGIRKFDDEDLACEFFLRYVEMMLGRRAAGGRTFRLLSPDEPGMRVDAVGTRLRDLGVGRWHYSIGAAVEEKYSLVPTAEGWQSSFPVGDREWDSGSPQSEASAVCRFLTIFQSMRNDYDSLSLDLANLARDE